MVQYKINSEVLLMSEDRLSPGWLLAFCVGFPILPILAALGLFGKNAKSTAGPFIAWTVVVLAILTVAGISAWVIPMPNNL